MNTAKVRFFTPNSGREVRQVAIYALQSGSCINATKLREIGKRGGIGLQLGGMSSDETDIGMLKNPNFDYESRMYVEVPVEAEKRFEFVMSGDGYGKFCRLNMSFIPKTGRQYEVGYFTNPVNCYSTVHEIAEVQGKFLRTEESTSQKLAGECNFFWN
jgi:hypothetical protein